jgi:hypothetical protein
MHGMAIQTIGLILQSYLMNTRSLSPVLLGDNS